MWARALMKVRQPCRKQLGQSLQFCTPALRGKRTGNICNAKHFCYIHIRSSLSAPPPPPPLPPTPTSLPSRFQGLSLRGPFRSQYSTPHVYNGRSGFLVLDGIS